MKVSFRMPFLMVRAHTSGTILDSDTKDSYGMDLSTVMACYTIRTAYMKENSDVASCKAKDL